MSAVFNDKVFIVPKAGILIPVLPGKSEKHLYREPWHTIFFSEYWTSAWKKVVSDPFSPLKEEWTRKEHGLFSQIKNKLCKFVSSQCIISLASLQTSWSFRMPKCLAKGNPKRDSMYWDVLSLVLLGTRK